MFEVTIVVIVLLVVTGAVLIGLEMELFTNLKGPAVAVITLLIGGAIYLFFLAEADGKIAWGDPIAGEEGGKKDGKDGGGRDEEGGSSDKGGGSGGDDAKEEEAGVEEKNANVETFRDCDICPLMVVVKRGKFKMGSPDDERGRRNHEGPVQAIKVGQSFAVSKLEITRAQYKAFVSLTGHRSSNECIVNGVLMAGRSYAEPGIRQENEDPAVCVSWHDASAYAAWLSQMTGGKYRLLSEAEWEYAARAGRPEMYNTRIGFSKMDANYNRTWHGTMPGGSFEANRFGIQDTHGNAWEWVADCWHDSFADRPDDARAWGKENSGDCSMGVIRGGAWDSDAAETRSASRSYEAKTLARNTIGIRVAKGAKTTEQALHGVALPPVKKRAPGLKKDIAKAVGKR